MSARKVKTPAEPGTDLVVAQQAAQVTANSAFGPARGLAMWRQIETRMLGLPFLAAPIRHLHGPFGADAKSVSANWPYFIKARASVDLWEAPAITGEFAAYLVGKGLIVDRERGEALADYVLDRLSSLALRAGLLADRARDVVALRENARAFTSAAHEAFGHIFREHGVEIGRDELAAALEVVIGRVIARGWLAAIEGPAE